MSDPIKTERRGHVLEVTLDRPKANAIDLVTSRIMGEVFAEFRDDPDLRVALVTGAGEKFFWPRMGFESRRRWRCGGRRLRQGRVRRLAGVARAEQAGGDGGQRDLLWWRAGTGLVR